MHKIVVSVDKQIFKGNTMHGHMANEQKKWLQMIRSTPVAIEWA